MIYVKAYSGTKNLLELKTRQDGVLDEIQQQCYGETYLDLCKTQNRMEEFKAFTKQITFDISATYEVLNPKIVFDEYNQG